MKKNYFLLLMIILVSGCSDESTSNLSSAEAEFDWNVYNKSVAVIGDSISTGIFANTKIGKFPFKVFGSTLESGFKNLGDLLNGDEDKYSETILKEAGDQKQLTAYGTGAPWGLKTQLTKIYPELTTGQISVQNVAHVGHRSTNMVGQMDQLRAIYAEGTPQAGHVFVLLGANDFCSGKSADEFKDDYYSGLKYVLDSYQKSNVVLGNLPPIDKLATDGNGEKGIIVKGVKYPKVQKSKKKFLGMKYPEYKKGGKKDIALLKCQSFRKDYCERMFEPTAAQEVAAFNKAIADIVAELSPQYPEHRLSIAKGISDIGITEEHFAWDCFHPSEVGQQDIAKAFIETYSQP